MTGAPSKVLAAVRAHPRHLILAALLAGLLAGSHGPPAAALAGCLLVAAVAGPRRAPLVALLAVTAVMGGAVAGRARLDAVNHFPAAGWFGHAVRGRAVVTGPPERDRWGGWHAPARLQGRWRGARVLLRAGAGVRPPPAGTGALVHVRGGLRRLSARERYLEVRGIGGTVRVDALAQRGVRGGIPGLVDGLRRRAARALRAHVPAAPGALLVGMVLGDPSGLGVADADALRAAGLTHLVAASGANVALLVALVLVLGVVGGWSQRTRLGLALLAIAVYVPLAGAGPSIQRAGVMGMATVVALLAGRPGARWYALLLAATVTLVVNPRAAQDPAWQLSFAAVLAIMLAARPLAAALRARRVPGMAAEGGAVTVVATLATAPLLALHFDRLSLVSLPANLAAAVAVAPAMWLGFAATVVGQVAPPAAAPLASLAALPASFILQVGRTAAQAPHATVAVGAGPVILGVAATGLLLLAAVGAGRPAGAARPARRVALVLSAAACAALTSALVVRPGPGPAPDVFQAAFLDVGQGDATLLRHGAAAILVDTGPPGGPVLRRLRELGVRRLDALVITHAQADHDGGAPAVLGALPVGVLLDGRDGVRDGAGPAADRAARSHRVRRVAAVAGTQVRAGPMTLRVLSPPARDMTLPPAGDPNDRAVVATVTDAATTILLTADAESDVTAPLSLPRVALLKVAHHGSADAGLPALLARLRPQVAVMEVGAHNTYGHPAPATVAALDAVVPAVGRTDRDGTVVVTARAGVLRVLRHAP